jgi:hypothetical protein
MALDPSIALGVRPIEVQNPLNQFAQVAQLQNFQRQSDLANRAIEQEEALNRAYASSIDQKTGQIDANKLRQNMAMGGIASKLPAAEKSIMESRKLTNEVGKGELELRLAKATQAIQDIARFSTREEIIADIQRNMDAGNIDPAKAQQIVASVPQDPTKIPAWQLQTMRGILSAKDQLEQQFTTQDYAGGTRVIATPKYGGGPAQVVQGSDIQKTATIADKLAREKFNWEKANPGFELKETENGDIVGVNKRTLEAFPVMMGGAAPAAKGPRVPANNLAPTPANVNNLAQPNVPQAGVASPTGVPLKGKGTALTETQSNATAYGMRMKEANAILEDLSKKGVLKGAVIERTPLIGGVLGQTLPGFLGGTNEAQQQVNQAKSNFITAVLRKESGAVISDSEFEREDRKYFPQINDSEKVIKQKENARKLAIDAIAIQAGPGAKNIRELQPSVGNSETDPLGLLGR